MTVLAMVALCAVGGRGAAGGDDTPPDDSPWAHALAEEGDSASAMNPVFGVWAGFKCQHASECPPGYLRKGDANLHGCVANGTVCTGTCYWCTGNPFVGGDFCVHNPGFDCIVVTQNPGPVNCGTITRKIDGCEWWAAPPTQRHAPTPNGCYCTTGITDVTDDTCMVYQCI